MVEVYFSQAHVLTFSGKGAALVAAAGGATAGLAAESQWRRSSNTSPRSSLPLLGESLEDERGTTSTSQRDGDVNPVQTGGTKAQGVMDLCELGFLFHGLARCASLTVPRV